MPVDEPKLYLETAPKMSAAIFSPALGSRSVLSCLFSHRNRATSAAKSDGEGMTPALWVAATLVAWIRNRVIHRLSTVSCRRSSLARGQLTVGDPINRLPLDRRRNHAA